MKRMISSFLAAAMLAVGASAAEDDCTAFVVGRKASATGRVIVGHNNDGLGPMKYAILPATDSAPALQELNRVPGLGGGKSPALYWQAVYSDKAKAGKATGDVLLNEHGVIMFSNSGGFMREWDGRKASLPSEATAKVTDGGLGLALRFEVVRRAKSAAEGVKIATALIDRYGYGPDARTFTIADRDEAWILCAVRGRRYVARRCPDDAVMAFPNILPVGKILPGDIVSPGIEGQRDAFDFAAAYQGLRTKHDPTQRYRILEFYRIAAGVTVDEDELPWSVKPAHPVSVDDLKRGFSSHAVGGGRESVHPEEKPGVAWPVCRRATLESVICPFAANPADTRISLAPGHPCDTKYDEFRPFRNELPAYFVTGAAAERLYEGRLCAPEDGLEARFARVKAVKDGVVTSLKVAFCTKADPEGKDPLAMWRAEAKESVNLKDAFVSVDFSLSPETGSDIKCRAELPLPEKWDGRMWGQGNSGRAGSIRSLKGYVASGTAAVTTDLGTSAVVAKGASSADIAWPAAIRRDFHWRATHLMTVYGKRIVEAFYGKPIRKAYFAGGSTGGRQAMSEAIRYPEDYDGLLVSLPDNNAAVSEIAAWHLRRQTHDAEGRSLFTTNEMRVVANAAIEYRAATDYAPYAGNILSDGRFDEADIDGFLALAAKKCPSLAEGDRISRLKALFLPLIHNGKCYFNGYAPGTYLGKNMEWYGLVSLRHHMAEKGLPSTRWKDVGWAEIDLYLKEVAPEFNACSPDLDAFRARGGKIIMSTGWEDQTVPPAPIIDYYERVCARDGGIGKTKEYFRLFCVPGCAHGGGRGRAITGSPISGAAARKLLVEWCENGVAPSRINASWRVKRLDMPIAAYPGLFVKDASGKWKERETKRGVARIDGVALETKRDL